MGPMATAFEIAFAAGLVVVGVSLAGVAVGRLPDRALVVLTVLLGLGALAAGGSLAYNLVHEFTDTSPLVLATGGLAASAIGEAGLLALAHALRRLNDVETIGREARGRLSALVEEETEQRRLELERTLARERANALHQLGEQERRLAEERRDLVARQIDRGRNDLTEAVAAVQGRLERRLAAWAADLDRGQRELEVRLA